MTTPPRDVPVGTPLAALAPDVQQGAHVRTIEGRYPETMASFVWPELAIQIDYIPLPHALALAGLVVGNLRRIDLLDHIVETLVYTPDWEEGTLDRVFLLMHSHHHFGSCQACFRITFTGHRFCPLCAKDF